MKKLKFLLIPLFSLLFLINVKADTITKELYYGTREMTKLENYETLLSNAIQYLKDNASTIDSLNSNINLTDDENVVKFDLTYSDTLTSPLRVNIIYNMSNSLLYQTGRYPYYKISNIYYYDFSLNFDSNYNITGYNVGNIANEQVTFTFSDNPEGGIYRNFYLDYRLGKNSTLNFTNNTSDNANFLIGPQDNQFEFNYGDNITLFDFAKYLSGVVEEDENKCISYDIASQFGVVRNVSAISVRVKGYSNIDTNYLNKGYFKFVSSDFNDIMIPINDFIDVSVNYDSDNTGVFNSDITYEWVNENGTTINDLITPRWAIYFNYSFTTESEENVYLDAIITIKIKNTVPAGNITFFDNSVDLYGNTYTCEMSRLSYGYINKIDNTTITSDPVIENYLNNLSLPQLKIFDNLSTLLPAGPVDSILVIPLEMLNSIRNSLSGTCEPLQITLPYINKNIQLQCMNSFYSNIGATNFFNSVGLVASTLMLISYFTFLYNWIDNTLRLGHNKLKTWGTGGV